MSSQYGWTDEAIMDLPVVRLRQITASIQTRRYLDGRQQSQIASWSVRNLAMFIAGGYQIDPKKGNPAMDMARTLAFDEIEATLLGSPPPEPEPDPGQPKEPTKVADIDPQEAIERALAKNSKGSFERFMRMDQGLKQRGAMI